MNSVQVSATRIPLIGVVAATASSIALAAVAAIVSDMNAWDFGTWNEFVVEVLWMFALASLVPVGFWIVEHHSAHLSDVAPIGPPPVHGRTIAVRAFAAAAVAGLGLAAFVHRDAGQHGTARAVSTTLFIATVTIRWPISVLAQQVLFFGWLQPRLGRHGTLVAAVSYAASHLWTPGALIATLPLGVIFALQRERTQRLNAGITTHYALNLALFAIR